MYVCTEQKSRQRCTTVKLEHVRKFVRIGLVLGVGLALAACVRPPQWFSCKVFCIDGQVRLVRLVRLQTDDFRLFLRTNGQTSVCTMNKRKRVNKNRLDFPFHFGFYPENVRFPCPCLHLYVSVSPWQLLFICWKQTANSVCLLQTETENGSLFSCSTNDRQ